jgi:hypothetical protein
MLGFIGILYTQIKTTSYPRAIVQLKGLGQLKNAMTSGIEPGTFLLVA